MMIVKVNYIRNRIISYIKNNKDKIYKKKSMRENKRINLIFNKTSKKVREV